MANAPQGAYCGWLGREWLAVADATAVARPVEIETRHYVVVRFTSADAVWVGALLDTVDVYGKNLVAVIEDFVTQFAKQSDTPNRT